MPEKISLVVDMVVFTLRKNELEVLLIKRKNDPFKGMYALPGGFVNENETVEAAAARELLEETNVRDIFLKRFKIYSDPGRDPRGRMVSVAFLALTQFENYRLESREDAEYAAWFSIYSLPKLAFDHKIIIDDAVRQLRFEIQTTNIAHQILPKKFTLSELQRLYSLVLDIEIDKRNFRKRIRAFDVLKPLKEKKMEGAHRPAQLFTFKDQAYRPLKERIHILV